jgi:hypothetical protein
MGGMNEERKKVGEMMRIWAGEGGTELPPSPDL